MITSIHQPVYLPWQPYFGKIASSDAFIFLDDVQYPGGKGFFNRNCIKGANGSILLTAPVTGRSERLSVKEQALSTGVDWQKKHWKSIASSYAKAKFFPEYSPPIQSFFLDHEWLQFSDMAVAFIKLMCGLMHIKTRIYLASELVAAPRSGLDHILELLDACDADAYLSGTGEGSLRYMDADSYKAKGVALHWHEYAQRPYSQLWGAYVPDLCVLDLVFNLGPHALEELLGCSTIRVQDVE